MPANLPRESDAGPGSREGGCPMRLVSNIMVALGGAVLLTPASVADLTKVERAIGKEPAYQSRSPRYALLVFGPEARERVWLVIDDKLLYADRNGDGDLTQKGECKRALTWGGEGGTYFEFGALTHIDGRKVHLAVRHQPGREGHDTISISVEGRDFQSVTSDARGPFRFASRPEDAPVVHV